MDQIHTKLKRAREIRCECVDEVTESPQSRAKKLLELFLGSNRTLDNWDGICFSIMYLSSQLSVVPDLKKDVESLAFKLMQVHYFDGGSIGLYDEESINTKVGLKLELEAAAAKVRAAGQDNKTGDKNEP